MDDLISRTAALDALNRIDEYNARSVSAIKALPSADRWISCSERLPGEDESFYVLCCDKYGEIMIGHVFACNDGETPYSAESEYEYMYDCVAWQPLPTPYREGGQDNA